MLKWICMIVLGLCLCSMAIGQGLVPIPDPISTPGAVIDEESPCTFLMYVIDITLRDLTLLNGKVIWHEDKIKFLREQIAIAINTDRFYLVETLEKSIRMHESDLVGLREEVLRAQIELTVLLWIWFDSHCMTCGV